MLKTLKKDNKFLLLPLFAMTISLHNALIIDFFVKTKTQTIYATHNSVFNI